MKTEHAVHVCAMPSHMERGQMVYKTERREVRVIARAEGYAMVRRKGCVPYVCREKELRGLGEV